LTLIPDKQTTTDFIPSRTPDMHLVEDHPLHVLQ